MPELPEVETVKRGLEKVLLNKKIENIKIRRRDLRVQVPVNLESDAVGAVIQSLGRRAKYLLINLSNNKTIIWHLGMSGRIGIHSEKPVELLKHDHVILETDDGISIVYNDARRFGLVDICDSEKLASLKYFSAMGEEPLEDSYDAKKLLSHLKDRKVPIKLGLLNQEIIAGLGNIYVCEALYRAGISPLRTCNEISLKEAEKLVIEIKEVLKEAIEAGGSTLKDHKRPDGEIGYFQNSHKVYGKEGQRCPNCTCDISKTGGIKRITQGGRSTFYCEKLQK